MRVLSSVLCVWLLNSGLSIWVCLYVCLHTCVGLALPSPPLPYQGLRLARTGGPIKTYSSCWACWRGSRGKDLFHCCVNHCFISTLLSPSFCSDIWLGFWPQSKCEHNTAIEIMARTSWPLPGSALALARAATTSCSKLHNHFFLFLSFP